MSKQMVTKIYQTYIISAVHSTSENAFDPIPKDIQISAGRDRRPWYRVRGKGGAGKNRESLIPVL